jgi:hypothetical protein
MSINEKLAARRKELGVNAPDPQKKEKEEIDAEVDRAIDVLARERMTKGENLGMVALSVLTVASFFITWWLGAFFLGATCLWLHVATSLHKDEIIAERKSRARQSRTPEESRRFFS